MNTWSRLWSYAPDPAKLAELALPAAITDPAVDDLTSRRAESGIQVGDYPTGAWGTGESRDYHLDVQVSDPDEVRRQVRLPG